MENRTVLTHSWSFFGKAMNVLIMLVKIDVNCILSHSNFLTGNVKIFFRNKESFFELYQVNEYGQGDQIQ